MNLALFDFDGTITDRDMFLPFMAHAVPPLRLALGKTLLAPLGLGYKAGLWSGRWPRSAAVRWAFSGVAETALRTAGEDFARTVLPTVLRPAAMQRIGWHKARGDRVVVVSGNFELLLAPWCRQHALELIGSRLAVRGGRLSGHYLGAQCVGEEKARRVRASLDLDAFTRIHAYGDTAEDHALLALAHERHWRGQRLPD